jgi:DNA-binding transcriptional LysR family regulator
MRGSDFAELRALWTIAEQGSFVRASKTLRISPSALSQTIRRLEERLGVRLLNRTTRSVAPSADGARLLARIGPAIRELDAAVQEVRPEPGVVRGALRLNVPRLAAEHLLAPILGRYIERHPQVVVELVVENALVDIVAQGFDAGVRLGERMQKDMVALKLGGDLEMMAVASPGYLTRFGTPETPRDLHRHRCINWRRPTDGTLYRWEFQRGAREIEVAVDGPLVVTDATVALRAAVEGVGIAYVSDGEAGPFVEAGQLVRVLRKWSPAFPGFYLYWPRQRQLAPPLRAFVDGVRALRQR